MLRALRARSAALDAAALPHEERVQRIPAYGDRLRAAGVVGSSETSDL